MKNKVKKESKIRWNLEVLKLFHVFEKFAALLISHMPCFCLLQRLFHWRFALAVFVWMTSRTWKLLLSATISQISTHLDDSWEILMFHFFHVCYLYICTFQVLSYFWKCLFILDKIWEFLSFQANIFSYLCAQRIHAIF